VDARWASRSPDPDRPCLANASHLLMSKGVARELGASLSVPLSRGVASHPGARPLPQSRRSASPAAGRGSGWRCDCEEPRGRAPLHDRGNPLLTGGPEPRCSPAGSPPGPAADQQWVDATNYILLELTQPLHAFALAKLRDPRSSCGEWLGGLVAKISSRLGGDTRALLPYITAICGRRDQRRQSDYRRW